MHRSNSHHHTLSVHHTLNICPFSRAENNNNTGTRVTSIISSSEPSSHRVTEPTAGQALGLWHHMPVTSQSASTGYASLVGLMRPSGLRFPFMMSTRSSRLMLRMRQVSFRQSFKSAGFLPLYLSLRHFMMWARFPPPLLQSPIVAPRASIGVLDVSRNNYTAR